LFCFSLLFSFLLLSSLFSLLSSSSLFSLLSSLFSLLLLLLLLYQFPKDGLYLLQSIGGNKESSPLLRIKGKDIRDEKKKEENKTHRQQY